MDWILLGKMVVILFALAGAVATLARRPDWLLSLAVASMGFGGFYVAAGTLLFPVKVVSMWVLFYLIFIDRRWIARLRIVGMNCWWLLVVWLVVAGMLGYLIEAPIADVSSGLQSKAFRPVVQIYGYFSTLSLLPLALVALTSDKDQRRFLNRYALSVAVVTLGGYLQLASFSLGFEFMPIVRLNGELQIAQFYFEWQAVQRIYSFAGEPKQLAVFLLPFFFISLVSSTGQALFEYKKEWWANVYVAAGVGLLVILTYSSAALIAMALAALIVILLGELRVRNLVFKMGLVAMFMIVANMVLQGSQGVDLFESIYERSVGRLEREIDQRFETQALYYLWDENWGLLPVGLGLGMYNYHIPGLVHRMGIEPIDSGWVVVLLDFGLVGACLFAWMLMFLTKNVLAGLNGLVRAERTRILAMYAGLISAVVLNAGTGALPQLMLWSGIVAGSVYQGAKKRKMRYARLLAEKRDGAR
ncbi:MAG: hypothetical protein ACU833_05660 [Gammaproteobacteria bacterium]